MDLITAEQRDELFATFQREALHLEMRDSYGTEAESPHMAKWAAGEPDDLEWLRPWCEQVQAAVATGKVLQRASVVSEPLSDYQRWSYDITDRHVEAGEDCRWVPRRLVSGIAVPGNDFWLFDDEIALFIVFDGAGKVAERQRWTDPGVIRLCRTAFDAVWALAIPHRDYEPA
jgi:hypothetical protein